MRDTKHSHKQIAVQPTSSNSSGGCWCSGCGVIGGRYLAPALGGSCWRRWRRSCECRWGTNCTATIVTLRLCRHPSTSLALASGSSRGRWHRLHHRRLWLLRRGTCHGHGVDDGCQASTAGGRWCWCWCWSRRLYLIITRYTNIAGFNSRLGRSLGPPPASSDRSASSRGGRGGRGDGPRPGQLHPRHSPAPCLCTTTTNTTTTTTSGALAGLEATPFSPWQVRGQGWQGQAQQGSGLGGLSPAALHGCYSGGNNAGEAPAVGVRSAGGGTRGGTTVHGGWRGGPIG